jgi:hypothetical protein
MNALAKKWVEALRSGKYEQGKNKLRSNDGKQFCCLGVLCQLAAPRKWVNCGGAYFHESGQSIAPLKVWSKVVGNSNLKQTRLSALNDSGASFSEIADEIERVLGGRRI